MNRIRRSWGMSVAARSAAPAIPCIDMFARVPAVDTWPLESTSDGDRCSCDAVDRPRPVRGDESFDVTDPARTTPLAMLPAVAERCGSSRTGDAAGREGIDPPLAARLARPLGWALAPGAASVAAERFAEVDPSRRLPREGPPPRRRPPVPSAEVRRPSSPAGLIPPANELPWSRSTAAATLRRSRSSRCSSAVSPTRSSRKEDGADSSATLRALASSCVRELADGRPAPFPPLEPWPSTRLRARGAPAGPSLPSDAASPGGASTSSPGSTGSLSHLSATSTGAAAALPGGEGDWPPALPKLPPPHGEPALLPGSHPSVAACAAILAFSACSARRLPSSSWRFCRVCVAACTRRFDPTLRPPAPPPRILALTALSCVYDSSRACRLVFASCS
mmetsp:Transcript_11126/g.42930  ORF Transcript_11126/g.42930 Transcript_11126/m.42930 type:complete len:392 (-) Transcript_11126:474-1649(-)